jgi:mannosylglucosylglycerate synthase
MKIAILHYAGPPGIGGVEATIAAHAALLADDGYAVRVVAGTGAATDERVAVRIEPLLGSRDPRIAGANTELARGIVSPAFYDLVSEIEGVLAGALDGCAVAIVHNVHTLHKNLALTAALHRLHTAGRAPRLLAWAHDFAWRDPLYLPELHGGWPWNLLREAWPGVRYVAVSHDRRAMLAELLGIPIEQLAVVPPGVDVARLLKLEPETAAIVQKHDLLDADPLLVLPARITRRKNIELAVRIVAALRDEGSAPTLVVTGPPGPHNPTNAAYLADLETLRSTLDARVLFLYQESSGGETPTPSYPVTDAHIADWLSLADGLLFPSRSEGFGMPVIEAALRGVPIFCADIPPFREIVGDRALVFALDEPPSAIAARIAAALRDDARYALRREVRVRYTWQAIYHHAIKPLLGGTSG